MTIALSAPPAPPLACVWNVFRRCLEASRNEKQALRAIERVRSPLSLRLLSGLSQAEFAKVLERYAGRRYGRSRLCQWEMPERTNWQLPRGYWKRYGMPQNVREAMHRLICDLVAWASAGRYRARVTGKRIWRVKLMEVKQKAVRP